MNCLNNNCGNGDFSQALKKIEHDSKCKPRCCIGPVGPTGPTGPAGGTTGSTGPMGPTGPTAKHRKWHFIVKKRNH